MNTADTAPRPVKPSLRARVALHVMVPLAFTWLVGTVAAVVTANYFAQQAFDRALLDDAYSVAANVRLQGGKLELSLTPSEIRNVLFDQSEKIVFAVLAPDGSLLAGHGGLHPAVIPPDSLYVFSELEYQGTTLRGVTVQRLLPSEFTVVIGQTTRSRSRLLQRLALYALAPQLLLLVLLAAWLRRAIAKDLEPLQRLQEAVEARDANDLTPVVLAASTREVDGLASATNDLLRRIAVSVRAQREFAGNVAHELRTPLAGIRALASYGLNQQDAAVWREQLQGIATSEARASHMVDQLLALALADEVRAGLQLQPVALDEVVSATVLRFMPRADAAGVDLGAQGLEQPVTVWAHPTLVEGLLENLLDNALRYGLAPDGGLSRVTVAIEQRPHGIALSVSDNGVGLSPTQREQVLQRWAQGPAGRELGLGSGLGLAIVALYAQSMRARLTLDRASEAGGLVAAVHFPSRPA